MTDANRQILNYVRMGLSVEEIADATGYPEEAINVVLVQNPKNLPRLDAEGSPEALEKSFAEMQISALNVIGTLMVASQDDNLRAKLAMYVTDQRLGLKKPAKAGSTLNIVVLKDEILKAKQLAESIDIPSENVTPAPAELAVAV